MMAVKRGGEGCIDQRPPLPTLLTLSAPFSGCLCVCPGLSHVLIRASETGAQMGPTSTGSV